jgi:hypothetical protein
VALSGDTPARRMSGWMPPKPVKRSAADYAALSLLLDEALEREGAARAKWLAELPDAHAQYKVALERMLARGNPATKRRLMAMEAKLRSGARALRRLYMGGRAPEPKTKI